MYVLDLLLRQERNHAELLACGRIDVQRMSRQLGQFLHVFRPALLLGILVVCHLVHKILPRVNLRLGIGKRPQHGQNTCQQQLYALLSHGLTSQVLVNKNITSPPFLQTFRLKTL